MQQAQALERRTFFFDRIRGTTQGIVQAGILTFGLLVAIRVYDAPNWLKASIPSAHSLGLLLTPFCLLLFRNVRWRSTAICAGCLLTSALLLLLVSFTTQLLVFIILLTLSKIALAQ